ncbi:sugar ABC transporter ATP-binding protein [Paenibacillus frigoriresistens]|uniref:sugar ABC transporter ATP-binding protein n=1 Tax=Paenibacillus alginolyticus TaxID=59839 RepID=UPI001563BA2F|nr:sugar ABC transporter ATP-binding protein [Paenibacillus frigoriresistens]NRF96162.1 sugar ABC transporter ATP-binding protein [Paenibacillus frigoriresistens]
MVSSPYLLEMKQIMKSFPGVQVLKGVDLRVRPGTVHALMGENGAGKSTLMKILIGLYPEYEGEIEFEGRLLKQTSIQDSLDAGISMIHQELTNVPYLTVAQNLLLGREPQKRFGWIRSNELLQKAKKLLESIGSDIDPNALMKDLSVSERQMVEIAKALSYNARLIIMDEPTSAITDREVVKLFEIIQGLKQRGVGIIYISHKMDEIFQIADEITVLRDGSYIGTKPADELDITRLIAMMVGRDLTAIFGERQTRIGKTVLAVKHLSRKEKFEQISFELREGEIIGIAGLMGAGRTELVSSIYGLDPYDSGTIEIAGRPVKIRKPIDAIRNGIGLVSEDRKSLGLVLPLSVKENISLPNFKLFSRQGWISSGKENRYADDVINNLSIKTSSREQKAKNLSGGNQQKIVIGKTLLSNPNVLILDEPTRGIDIGAKTEIYRLIHELAEQGKAIILVSSELPEILGLSDRILVLHEGRLVGEIPREQASEELVMRYAFGKYDNVVEEIWS